MKAHNLYGNLPLYFELNQGQTDPGIKYLSRGRGHGIYLASDGVYLVIRRISDNEYKDKIRFESVKPEEIQIETRTIKMSLPGSSPSSAIEGMDKQAGIVNYFKGNDPEKWHTKVPTYKRVKYSGVYPGIDVVYYGKGGSLEHDFLVSPGSNPGSIKLMFEGADSIDINDKGDLVLRIGEEELLLHRPLAYQMVRGKRKEVPCSYIIDESNTVSFEVAGYDTGNTLVIDPVVSYSTYLGGTNDDIGYNIAVDNLGNAYITGHTSSYPFPGTEGSSIQNGLEGEFDAIVTKINPGGTQILYSTYLGGTGYDFGNGITVDNYGNAYITGNTSSLNFPGAADSPIQSQLGGLTDGFVTKINPDGTQILYSTYLGGNGGDVGNGIAVDNLGNAYITGYTESDSFPGTENSTIQSAYKGGSSDAFVTKINSGGTQILYSTYLGGTSQDVGHGIAVDNYGNAYITGVTSSDPFPGTTNSPIQPNYGGGPYDAFVTKIKHDGSEILYSTYLGGPGDDRGFGITVDNYGNAYITGVTSSDSFPGTSYSPIQSQRIGPLDAFVTKINTDGTNILYSTYLGGTGSDVGNGIAIDNLGNAYITGFTNLYGFPGTADSPIQSQPGGGDDAFVVKINPNGTQILYSTYLGGSQNDYGYGIAVDRLGNAYITGSTESDNFPGISPNSIQSQIGGGQDAFVVKISEPQRPTRGIDLEFLFED